MRRLRRRDRCATGAGKGLTFGILTLCMPSQEFRGVVTGHDSVCQDDGAFVMVVVIESVLEIRTTMLREMLS